MGNYTSLTLLKPKGIESDIQNFLKNVLDNQNINLFGDDVFKTNRVDYVGLIVNYAKHYKENIKIFENSEDFTRIINIDCFGDVKFDNLTQIYINKEDLNKYPSLLEYNPYLNYEDFE